MPYCYFVITPDFGDNGRCRYKDLNSNQECVFVKFGITTNGNLDTVRTGYSTHNPSHRFIKFAYNSNIAGRQISIGRYPSVLTITLTADLGKNLQKMLAHKGMTQVGNTEWMSSGNVDMARRIADFLLKYENEGINEFNVDKLMISLYKDT